MIEVTAVLAWDKMSAPCICPKADTIPPFLVSQAMPIKSEGGLLCSESIDYAAEDSDDADDIVKASRLLVSSASAYSVGLQDTWLMSLHVELAQNRLKSSFCKSATMPRHITLLREAPFCTFSDSIGCKHHLTCMCRQKLQ